MVTALLLTLREGFEAALISAVMLAYLKKSGNAHLFRYIWLAIASALAVTVVAGVALFATTGEFEGRAEEIFEGTVMVVAALVITHVWRRFHNIRRATEQKTVQSLSGAHAERGIFLAAFVAVLIEGLEVILFLLASVDEGAASTVVGGLVGLSLAVVAGWLFYQSNRMGDAILFFYLMSAILILLAAGLLAKGIHEFQEVGFLPIFAEHLWDLNDVPVIGETAGLGKFLKSVFGYDTNPSLLQFIAWSAYVTLAAWYFNARVFVQILAHRLGKALRLTQSTQRA